MNNKKIEKYAVKAITDLILEHDLLDDEIQYNDKTESFDGIIKVYKDERQTKEGIKFVDVQVKGLNNEKYLKKESFTYQVDIRDLENYYNRRGAIFFVVVISDDKSKMIVFYNDFTPLKLNKYLKKHKKKNKKTTKKPSIEMKRLKKQNRHELYVMILNFIYNLEHQGAKSLNGDIITLPIGSKCIDKINFKYITANDPIKPIDILRKKEEYVLYGITKDGLCAPITFDNIIQSCIIYSNERPIKINDKIYYEKTNICELDNGDIKYIYSDNLSMLVKNSLMDSLNLKAIGTIDSILNDLEFLLEMLNYSEKRSDTSDTIDKDEVIKKENEVKDLLDYFCSFKKLFDTLEIDFKQKFSDIKENDLKSINKLIDINNDNLYINNSENIIKMLKIDNKYIPIFIENNLKEKKSKLYNVLSNKMEVYENTIGIKIPLILYLDESVLSNLYYIDFSMMRRKIEKLDLNEDNSIGIINNFLLNLIKCYDDTNNYEYLNLSLILSKRMYKKVDKFYVKLNYFQVLKRMDKLETIHYDILENILEETKENTIILAANILLENKYNCKKIISDLSQEKLENFKHFPIYTLYEQIL
ncbi:DUF4365 domain-containing protein [Intestinibacter bartlettii]|uniref:DUF4365 domain-containing protein n=1 Tax=Intestinibacter bartlettii TaxID=261299 RepID=UPI0034ABA8BD